MLGCGPGALVVGRLHDGHRAARPSAGRMEESLDAIMRLLECEEPVTMKTDWFELNEARLHLAPYTDPHFPIAVRQHHHAVGHDRRRQARRRRAVDRRRPARRAGGAGQAVGDRRGDRGQARQDGRPRRSGASSSTCTSPRTTSRRCARSHAGERRETVTYFEDTLGRPPGRSDDPLREGVKMGTTLVGSPDTVAKGIERLLGLQPGRLRRRAVPRPRMGQPRSRPCAATSCSPATSCRASRAPSTTSAQSREWCSENRSGIFGPSDGALRKAFTDAGQEVPDHMRMKLHTGKVDL